MYKRNCEFIAEDDDTMMCLRGKAHLIVSCTGCDLFCNQTKQCPHSPFIRCEASANCESCRKERDLGE